LVATEVYFPFPAAPLGFICLPEATKVLGFNSEKNSVTTELDEFQKIPKIQTGIQ
jgi:hypothetical protein